MAEFCMTALKTNTLCTVVFCVIINELLNQTNLHVHMFNMCIVSHLKWC